MATATPLPSWAASPCPRCISPPRGTTSWCPATALALKTASIVFNAMGDARKTLVVFAGGSHSIFTDRSNTGGAELNPKVKAATQALSLAFLKQTLVVRPMRWQIGSQSLQICWQGLYLRSERIKCNQCIAFKRIFVKWVKIVINMPLAGVFIA